MRLRVRVWYFLEVGSGLRCEGLWVVASGQVARLWIERIWGGGEGQNAQLVDNWVPFCISEAIAYASPEGPLLENLPMKVRM